MSYVAGPGLNETGSEALWELKCDVSKLERSFKTSFFLSVIIPCNTHNAGEIVPLVA